MYKTKKAPLKKNLLELINEFNEAAGYKINTWKSVVFLSTNNELSERESKKPILFKITSKKNKIPRNKPTRRWKTYTLKKYKTLMKEIEDGPIFFIEF